jgi:hypothetical protein
MTTAQLKTSSTRRCKWMVAFKNEEQYRIWLAKRPTLWHRKLKDVTTGIIYVQL